MTVVLELLFNFVLMVFFSYCFYFIGVSMPKSLPTELGPEQWPQLILGALIVLIGVNMYNIYKKTPISQRNFDEIKAIRLMPIFKSKLFIGIVIIFAYTFTLEPLGFLLSSIVMFAAYALLQGERRPLVLAAVSIGITLMIYFIFSKGLGIMLPRGYGVLRDLALLLESF